MLKSDQLIVKKAYELFKEGSSLNDSIVDAIGGEDVPSTRVNNICSVLNHMVHSRNKKDGKQASRFEIARPEEVIAKLASRGRNVSQEEKYKSNVQDYTRRYKTTPKTSSYSASQARDRFRDVVDLHRKLASAENLLGTEAGRLQRKYQRAELKLIDSIKTAYAKGNSLLQIEAALVSCNPHMAKIAFAFCKSAGDAMIARGHMDSKEHEKFQTFPHENLFRKLASDPLELEESPLKTAYQNFLYIYGMKTENDKKLDVVKQAMDTSHKIKDNLEKLGFEKIARFLGSGGLKDILTPKNIGGFAALNLALEGTSRGMDSVMGAVEEATSRNERSEDFLKVLKINPDLEESPETFEYYRTIVEANPIYKNKPYQMGRLIKSLKEQGQIVTPDMIGSLAKGKSKKDKPFSSSGLYEGFGKLLDSGVLE